MRIIPFNASAAKIRKLLSMGWLLLLVPGLMIVAFSCNEVSQQGANKKSDPAENDDDDDDDNDDYNDDDDDFDSGGGQTVAELLEECGGDGIKDAKPDEVIYEGTLKSVPSLVMGIARIQTTAKVVVTGSTTVQDSLVDVQPTISFGPLDVLMKGLFDSVVAGQYNGKTTTQNVPFNEYVDLQEDDAWDGVLCTFVPATKMKNERGGNTTATFDPPMPMSLSPRAAKARYMAEIGDKRVFKNMKVKIVETDDDRLSGVDKEITGTVTVEKVNPSTTVKDDKDNDIEIKGDLAYRMTYDFGSPEVTMALGLAPEMTYYISYDRKDVVGTVLDTKNETSGVVVFLNPKE